MRQETDDAELVEGFQRGETSAFGHLVLKYQDRIYNLCRHVLGDAHDAEDAAQDTFTKAYLNLNKFKPEASFYTWLYRIAVNTCLDYKKRPFFESIFGSHVEGDDASAVEPFSGEASPEKLYESKQLGQALHESLGKLSLKLRTVIVLKEIESLSYEEIADILDVSVGTVKSRIFRAREELKTSLKRFREQK